MWDGKLIIQDYSCSSQGQWVKMFPQIHDMVLSKLESVNTCLFVIVGHWVFLVGIVALTFNCLTHWILQRVYWFLNTIKICSDSLIFILYIYTVWCRYNAVNFLTNIHKRHPIARPLGRGMGCILWIQRLIDTLSQFMQLFMQYLTILDRVITALHSMCKFYCKLSDIMNISII